MFSGNDRQVCQTAYHLPLLELSQKQIVQIAVHKSKLSGKSLSPLTSWFDAVKELLQPLLCSINNGSDLDHLIC